MKFAAPAFRVHVVQTDNGTPAGRFGGVHNARMVLEAHRFIIREPLHVIKVVPSIVGTPFHGTHRHYL